MFEENEVQVTNFNVIVWKTTYNKKDYYCIGIYDELIGRNCLLSCEKRPNKTTLKKHIEFFIKHYLDKKLEIIDK